MENMEKWRLGEDLTENDNLLDPVTFNDLILSVHCGCKMIDPAAVRKTLNDILITRMEDMEYLLSRNMDEIINAAKRGRDS